ncbi:MAG: PspC domain-containing protein [Melioribacteraceae bacterium]|nr:PspC domain-containing protein [Melioribacteraceae bacterium]MCO6474288.1 PspC domain-containing protein [Melioribacteraceae bacterium]MDD3557915.1 PspC domain-containing protein [Melioribacteraceae bacterium]
MNDSHNIFYEPGQGDSNSQPRRLVRSNTDYLVFGLCGGIADYFRISSNLIRSFFIVSSLIGGWGIAAYIFSLIFLKKNPEKISDLKNSTRDNNFKFSAGFSLTVIGFLYTFELAGLISYSKFFGISRDLFLPVLIISAGLFILFVYHPVQKRLGKETVVLKKSGNKRILGVCGGLAEYLNAEPVVVRMFWLIFSLITLGVGTVIYFLFYLLIPESKAERQ